MFTKRAAFSASTQHPTVYCHTQFALYKHYKVFAA